MDAVRNAIDKSLAERDQNVDKFCTSLDKDIAQLGKEVKAVKQEAQVGPPWLATEILHTFCQKGEIMFVKFCNKYLALSDNSLIEITFKSYDLE